MKLLAPTTDSVGELSIAAESIASFAASGVAAVGEVAGKLTAFLPDMIRQFAQSKEVGKIEDVKNLSNEEQAFLKHLETASFAEVRLFRADLPEGFVGNLLAYSQDLASYAETLSNLSSQVLLPYTVFLAQLMSSPDPSKILDDHQAVYSVMASKRQAGYDALGAYFKGTQSSTRIGDVMSRNSDFKPLFENIKKAVDAVNAVNRAELSQLITQAEDYLQVLYNQMHEGKMQSISPEASRALADGAYQVAAQVEYYSLIHFKVLALSQSVKATVLRVNEILS